MRVFIAAMAAMFVALPAVAADQPNWGSNLDRALSNAESSGEYVLIAVGATYCAMCERNKQTVLSNSQVIRRLNASFNPVYITADEADASYRYQGENRTGSDMMGMLNLNGFPIYLVLDGAGNEIQRIQGRLSVDSFLEWLPS